VSETVRASRPQESAHLVGVAVRGVIAPAEQFPGVVWLGAADHLHRLEDGAGGTDMILPVSGVGAVDRPWSGMLGVIRVADFATAAESACGSAPSRAI
jgi:hypothetical protein